MRVFRTRAISLFAKNTETTLIASYTYIHIRRHNMEMEVVVGGG